jgi:hypothetical protein
MAAHGTTSEYRSGCRCVKCKAANTAAARRHRARNAVARTRRARPKVVGLPVTGMADAVIGMGRNERAVRDECENLERAVERPTVVAQAITVAQRLDDPACYAMAATLSRQLQSLMQELQVPKKKLAPKRLAVVQAMTNARR